MTIKRSLNSRTGGRLWLLPCLLALAGCTAMVNGSDNPAGPDGSSGNGNVGPMGSSGGSGSPMSNAGGGPASGGGANPAGGAPALNCPTEPMASRAPMRRLTRFEYNNTLRDLKLDSTNLASGLPGEELGNGFSNDADLQTTQLELVKAYQSNAETIASQVASATALASILPCATNVTTANEAACAKSFIEDFGPKAFRRPLDSGESDSFMSLFTTVRATSNFSSSVGAVLEAMLQDPAFVYRPEFGVPVSGRSDLLRPTGWEMATRLAYLFWGTTPTVDPTLVAAAKSGALDTPDGVRAQAATMLADPRARAQVRFFFDNLLPIASLNQLERDTDKFPTYNAKIGNLLRQETETFLDHQVFDGSGNTWPSVFTADYTYMNEDLAKFYGVSGVTGSDFKKVSVDPKKRLGLLSQAGIAAGPIHSNSTNPVVRGGFVVRKLLCQNIPLPTGAIQAMVFIPPDDPKKTTRQRFTDHSANPVCAGCHTNMDPVGFAFENFDPIGQWRDTENGTMIDASGTAPALGSFSGPAELGKKMAESPAAQQCFALNWANFAYARTSAATGTDACVVDSIQTKFKDAGYNVQKLLLALAESDAFLYLPAVRE